MKNPIDKAYQKPTDELIDLCLSLNDPEGALACVQVMLKAASFKIQTEGLEALQKERQAKTTKH